MGVGDELPVEVLRCIDRAIGFPLIFELTASHENGAASDQIRVAAIYKRPSETGAPLILLDNFNLNDLERAVQIANGRAELVASGNITLENVRAISASGVDYISIGSPPKTSMPLIYRY